MQAFRFAAAFTVAALVAAPALAQDAAAPVPATPAPAPVAAPTMALPAKGDTIETLRASGQFTILLKALDLTQLSGVIKAQPALTLFAPTDAAFRALPAGELDRLMKNPAAMQGVLTYHLINAPVDSAKLAGAKGPVTTVAGSGLVLDGSAGALKANGANILTTGVKTSNGYVYAVDQVLSPAGAAAAMAEPAAPVEEAPAAPAS